MSLKSRLQPKRVKEHSALVHTTISPASSASPSICWAMVKDAMAVEEAKTPVSDTSYTPRKPIATARPRNSAGKTTSLPAQTAASSRI